MRKIIVTADDFGAHPFIDEGIRKAVLAGCVNTVSAFMTFEDPISRISKLLNDAGKAGVELNVGIHVSLTAGTPVLFDEAFTLTYEGGKFMEIDQYKYDQVDPVEVHNEVRAQVSKFRDELGMPPDHLSCHHGIMYLFPDFFKAYLKIAREFGIPVRKPVPISTEYINGFREIPFFRESMHGRYRIIGNRGTDRVGMKLTRLTRKSLMTRMNIFLDGFVKCPDYFIDTFYRKGSEKKLLKILKNLPRDKTSELVLHLGEGNYQIDDQERKKYCGIDLDKFPARRMEFETIVNQYNLKERIDSDPKLKWGSFRDL
jgi:predicted glycoside hydrolase/deacetylase ChbG (UPF0249 family)